MSPAIQISPPIVPDPLSLSSASPPPVSRPRPSTRPIRSTNAPSHYGNIVSYASITRGVTDADNPTYAQAMAGPDAHHWCASMEVEFNSLVSHSVGRLITRPKNAKVLGGMW